jgi:ADP-ribose pyrophosphatase YjhB (NUDIX family)
MTTPTDVVRRHATALLAIAQTGLTYGPNVFDRIRYQEVHEAAVALMELVSNGSADAVRRVVTLDSGHATPKVEVRGALFDSSGRVLLVHDRLDGLWTLPGGWTDVLESPSESVCREVLEESGYTVSATKLVAVLDREKNGHQPPLPFHVYKFFFLCEEISRGEPDPTETLAVDWFPLDALPPLSHSRVLESQIRLLHEHWQNPDLATVFD